MTFVSAALASEGESDDEVLTTLLGRGLEDLCQSEVRELVDVGPVISLRRRNRPLTIESVVESVQDLEGGHLPRSA